ncbi:MAG: lysophospholipid acyltransferase family protein [Proteobacteria bacterium]|nr:lysophospholipid acyltransferase family protein [Pseudomonadota bacterium]
MWNSAGLLSKRQSGMMRAREALARGETFVAWPEGTRSKDGSLGVFHNGIFRLALEVGISVTPVVFTSSGPVFNNRGRFRETPRTVIFTATLEPKIIFNQPNRVTPGRVVLCRDSVRNFFLERLSQADIPEWMRLSSCWREKSESDFCRPPTGSESAERQSSELLCDVSDLIPRSARAKSLQDAENFDHAQSLGRVGMESI